MTVGEFYDTIVQYVVNFMNRDIVNQSVRIHIGNQLYDVDHIGTVIDMDTNKPNVVIHVKEN
nr:MAG TPA: hypothetical protein [Caudoviricetes sp.]